MLTSLRWFVFSLCTGALGYDVKNAIVKMPGSLGLTLHVYAPDVPSASNVINSFPVIWFATGFGCANPVSLYSEMLSKIVAKGYIVAGVWHKYPHIPSYIKDGHNLHSIMEWGKQNLGPAMVEANLYAVPDVVERSAIMGQSAGNHIAGEALNVGCSVAKAFVMIDPVDGYDPYRFVKSQDLIKPGEKVKFKIPALMLDNGLDPKSVNRFEPPCAPQNVSNDHFYNAWTGPIWNINATAYGHVDCTDAPGTAGLICPYNKTIDKDPYRSMLAEATATFLEALFEGKQQLLPVLEEAAHWKLDVVLKHDLKGMNYSEVVPSCVNTGSSDVVV